MTINMEQEFGDFLKQPVKFRDQVRFLAGEKKTLIVNMETRYNLFLSNDVLGFFQSAEHDNDTYRQLIESFHKDDQDYICEVIIQLVDHFMMEGSAPPLSSEIIEISLDITGRCNLHCKHCCVSAGDSVKGADLSTKELKTIIDEITAFNPKSISISGGEPLVRSDFVELITYIRKKYTGEMELLTNGTLITREMARFIGTMFQSVSISTDGIDEESCAIIRGTGAFTSCMKGVQLLKEETSCKLSLSMVVCKENEHHVRAFHAMCRELDASPIVRTLSPSDRLSQNEDAIHFPEPEAPLSGEALAKYLQKYKEKKLHKTPPETFSCQAARRQFQIDYAGNIYPCPALMDDEFLMGNLFKIRSLSDYILNREYLNSEGYRNLQKYMPYNIERCKGCNKNLLCGTCVAMIRDDLKQGTYFDHCEENNAIYSLFWED